MENDLQIIEQDVTMSEAGEFFGTLQQSIIVIWRAHLATSSYAEHIALNEYYDGMLDKVDALIENYQGINGKIKRYKNIISEFEAPLSYLETIREVVRNGREQFCKESELQSLCDDILSLINSTIYKIRELK